MLSRGTWEWYHHYERQIKKVARQYSRQKTLSNKRINYMKFKWASNLVGIRDRGWAGRAQKAFVELDTLNVSQQSNTTNFIIMTRKACQLKGELNWKNDVERINAMRGIGLNKLRTYKLFKTEYKVEEYVLKVKGVNQRLAMSHSNKFMVAFFKIQANERFWNFLS